MAIELDEITVQAGEHVVQFYEDDLQLAQTVSGYLTTARDDGAVAIVIATEAHRHLFVAELEVAGADPAASSRDGTLILLDAADTMAGFVQDGQVDHESFRRVIGSVIQQAAQRGRSVRAYGEMVALLWEAGNVLAAIELEKAWNDLARELPFALLCAYRSDSVQGDEHAEAVQQVCHLHTAVVATPGGEQRKPLAAADVCAHFSAERHAPGSARRFVADVLRASGHPPSLLENAKLVVSELATNAVIHARSPFTVEVGSHGAAVRLSVRDASRTAPTLHYEDGLTVSGRGVRLVDVLAVSWGVEIADEGKTVWAELRP